VNDHLRSILTSIASATQPAARPQATPPMSVTLMDKFTTIGCSPRKVRPSRLLRYGAQLVNAFVVGNAVRHGSYGHVLGGASPAGYIGEYVVLDLLIDHIDHRMNCETQNKLNALFALGAIYNAGQTQFPR